MEGPRLKFFQTLRILDIYLIEVTDTIGEIEASLLALDSALKRPREKFYSFGSMRSQAEYCFGPTFTDFSYVHQSCQFTGKIKEIDFKMSVQIDLKVSRENLRYYFCNYTIIPL